MSNPAQIYDVAIIGGGPAGVATALSLKRNKPLLSVAIIEASRFDSPRVGETLAAIATPLLRQLGLYRAVTDGPHLPVYASAAAWGSSMPISNEYFSQPHQAAWHLDRNQFDRALLGYTQTAGIHYLPAKMRDLEKIATGWSLHLSEQHTDMASPVVARQISARFVVDASGRRATLAKRLGQRPQQVDNLVASIRFFDCATSNAPANTLIEANQDGWWYSAQLPDQRLVMAAMTDADLARQLQLHTITGWQNYLAGMQHSQRRCLRLAASACMAPLMRAAHSQILPSVCGDAGWLAVGDAASCVDPLSSQGIVRALRSGIIASYAICDWFAGKKPGLPQYQKLILTEFDNYLDTLREVYCQEQRWPNAPFWARRQHVAQLRRA